MASKRKTQASARTERKAARAGAKIAARNPRQALRQQMPQPAEQTNPIQSARASLDAAIKKVDRPATFRNEADERNRLTPNDTADGVIRDPVVLEGKPVSYVADVGVQHPDYDPHVKQVIVQDAGGTRVVPEEAILTTYTPPVADQHRAKRVPGATFPAGHPANMNSGQGR